MRCPYCGEWMETKVKKAPVEKFLNCELLVKKNVWSNIPFKLDAGILRCKYEQCPKCKRAFIDTAHGPSEIVFLGEKNV